MTSELETGVSELADVIASSDTVLGTHGVDYFARSKYSFRSGKVVFRWFWFFLPMLANRAVIRAGIRVRVLLAMLKSACLVSSILYRETTAPAALLAWGWG